MKCQLGLPFYLLLWTLTVLVSCGSSPEIKVDEHSDGIKVICPDGYEINGAQSIILPFKDESTGEYVCNGTGQQKIFVKLRTCDNCVELDIYSVFGMVIGELVAMTVIGVGVYLVASQAQTGPAISNKKSKSSDRQHLVSNESRGPTNDHYQPLRRGGQKDTYEELRKK